MNTVLRPLAIILLLSPFVTAWALTSRAAEPTPEGADNQSAAPRPVPLTRPEMKQFLEDMKARKPRIPLPELTAGDKEKLGDRAENYEARLRYHYLGQNDMRVGGGGPREADPAMSLDYAFKTELFWIVSRTNNCQY
jgi:hypothetical protein